MTTLIFKDIDPNFFKKFNPEVFENPHTVIVKGTQVNNKKIRYSKHKNKFKKRYVVIKYIDEITIELKDGVITIDKHKKADNDRMNDNDYITML